MRTYKPDPDLAGHDFTNEAKDILYQTHSKLKLKIANCIRDNPGIMWDELIGNHFYQWSASTIRNYVTEMMKADIVRSEPTEDDKQKVRYYITQDSLEEFL